jgi:hypothetical protein
MFIHELPTATKLRGNRGGDEEKKTEVWEKTKLQHVFVECDWFRQVGVDPLTRLRIIEYEPNWNGVTHVMLARCLPVNCVFWPVDPFTLRNRKAAIFDLKSQQLNVILYHEEVA